MTPDKVLEIKKEIFEEMRINLALMESDLLLDKKINGLHFKVIDVDIFEPSFNLILNGKKIGHYVDFYELVEDIVSLINTNSKDTVSNDSMYDEMDNFVKEVKSYNVSDLLSAYVQLSYKIARNGLKYSPNALYLVIWERDIILQELKKYPIVYNELINQDMNFTL